MALALVRLAYGDLDLCLDCDLGGALSFSGVSFLGEPRTGRAAPLGAFEC